MKKESDLKIAVVTKLKEKMAEAEGLGAVAVGAEELVVKVCYYYYYSLLLYLIS